jgi:hypothetical protein
MFLILHLFAHNYFISNKGYPRDTVRIPKNLDYNCKKVFRKYNKNIQFTAIFFTMEKNIFAAKYFTIVKKNEG